MTFHRPVQTGHRNVKKKQNEKTQQKNALQIQGVFFNSRIELHVK